MYFDKKNFNVAFVRRSVNRKVVLPNLVPRAMPVRRLGGHWLWGNGMNFAISLAAVRSINARPVLAIPCGIFVGNTRGIKRME